MLTLPVWWLQVRHFEQEEFSYPQFMKKDFVTRLDEFRQEVGSVCMVTSSNDPEDEHSPNSLHYEGEAADIILPTSPLGLLDLTLCAMRFFNGVGLYPEWRYDNTTTGGLHVEYSAKTTRMKQWMGISLQNGKNKYVALNEINLADSGII